MKKLAFIFGTIGVILFLLILLFKIHHWPGAGLLLTYGSIFNCIIVLPLIAIYLFKSKPANNSLYLFGTLSLFIIVIGLILKINHLPASDIVHAIGTGLFIVFSVLFARNLYGAQNE